MTIQEAKEQRLRDFAGIKTVEKKSSQRDLGN